MKGNIGNIKQNNFTFTIFYDKDINKSVIWWLRSGFVMGCKTIAHPYEATKLCPCTQHFSNLKKKIFFSKNITFL